MNAVSRAWGLLGLSNRFAITAGLTIVFGFAAVSLLMAQVVAIEARRNLDEKLETHLFGLAQAVAVSLQAGQSPAAAFRHYADFASVRNADFRSSDDRRDVLEVKSSAEIAVEAPSWFEWLADMRDREGRRPVLVGGRPVGEVSARVSAGLELNEAWHFWLSRQPWLALGPFLLFACLWFVLRSNLRPLEMLARGSAALGRGDFSQRLDVTGSHEIRITLQAFNAMAANLERLVASLNESERLYSSLVKTAPVGIFRTDAQGAVFYANDVLLRMSGISRAGMPQERWAAACHPEDRRRVAAFWTEAVQNQAPIEAFIFRYMRPDGSETWAQARAEPLFDDKQGFEGHVGVVTDITAERALHARVERSEHNLNVTLRSIGDAVVVTDTAGRVTLLNPVAEALTGWTEAEARGRPSAEVFRIVNAETRAPVDSPVDRVLKEGVIVGLANHTVLIAKDGTERPIADSGAPIRYVRDGEINGVVLVFRDQSEEYRMQKALRDSERRYAALVETVPVGVFQVDLDGNTAFGNAMMARIADLPAPGATLQQRLAAIHPEDRAGIAALWRDARMNGQTVATTYRYRNATGVVTWARMSMAPVRDGDGKLRGYIGGVVDITESQRHLQQAERLQRLYATLSRVNSLIIQALDQTALFEGICAAIAKESRFDRVLLTFVDWDTRQLHERHSAGPLATTPVDYRKRSIDDPALQSITSLALLEDALVVSMRYWDDARIAPAIREIAAQTRTASAAAVPIRCGGRSVAALTVASHEEDFFTDDVQALIKEIARDISFALDNFERSEQKREADAALARSEQNLNVTLRSIGDAVLVTDAQGRVTLMNPVAEALTGWHEADAIGLPAADVFRIVNAETRAVVDSPVDRVLREGAIVGLANHTVLIARDGSETPIADSGAPIRYGHDNEISGVVLVFRDQSAEYRMQKALRDSEALYAALADHAPMGIYLADANGEFQYVNDELLRIFGSQREGFSTAAATAFIHPEDRERLTAAWFQACRTVGTTHFSAYRYLRSDGRTVWARGVAAKIVDSQGSVTRTVGAVVDVTEEHEHAVRIERLSRLYVTLSQINVAISQSKSEAELFDRVCRVATERGGFSAAVFYTVDAAAMRAQRASYSGPHNGVHPETIDISGDAPWSLVRETLQTGRSVISVDLRCDERLTDYWRDAARAAMLEGAVAMILTPFGMPAATFMLHGASEDMRNAELLALADEMRRDLSHAMENLVRDRDRVAAEKELARNEARLRMGLSVTGIGMYEVDFVERSIALDATCMKLMGMGDKAAQFDAAAFPSVLRGHARSSLDIGTLYGEVLRGKRESFEIETTVTNPDGSERWLRNHGAVTAESTGDGRPVRMLGVISDVTDFHVREERDRLAAAVFDNSGEAIVITDARRRIVMVNQAFLRVSGYEQAEILGQRLEMLRSDRHDKAFYADLHRKLEAEGIWQGEIWRKRKSGEVYPTLAAVSLVKDDAGNAANIVMQEIDISMQKEFEQRIRHLAYRDALTGLPNRTLLRDRAEQSIALAHREASTLALLFIDLDNFKNINDSLGHAIGDRLLEEVARRLTQTVRETDTVGRLGGDEFLVMLPDADADAAAHVAQKLLEECVRPLQIETHALMVTPSIGISLYPKDGGDFDELLKMADTAMYRAKDEGRNGYRFYTPEMNQAVFQRMVMESSLRRAIENREFVLHYQPKFELRNQTLVGVEALIRWCQPDMDVISPAQFIPVAEESGLIEAIGKWVLEAACRQAKAWRAAGLAPLRVAVNFSARQFAARNIIELVTQTLHDTGLSGDGLEMEITESLLAQDMDYTLEVLRAVKRLGVHIAVDDFGTGYSSLSYLKRFPIDRLKIDQSFVRDIADDVDDRAIATAVVTMGHSLGMRVIAEGVETEKQIDILRSMGCDEVQGFYLGRPLPAEEMTTLLRAQARKPSRVG